MNDINEFEIGDYYTDPGMARLLGIKIETLRKRICIRRDHPPYSQVGDRRLWPKSEFKKWLEDRSHREVRDEAKQVS